MSKDNDEETSELASMTTGLILIVLWYIILIVLMVFYLSASFGISTFDKCNNLNLFKLLE